MGGSNGRSYTDKIWPEPYFRCMVCTIQTSRSRLTLEFVQPVHSAWRPQSRRCQPVPAVGWIFWSKDTIAAKATELRLLTQVARIPGASALLRAS